MGVPIAPDYKALADDVMLTGSMKKDGGNEMRFCECNIQMAEMRFAFVIETYKL